MLLFCLRIYNISSGIRLGIIMCCFNTNKVLMCMCLTTITTLLLSLKTIKCQFNDNYLSGY